MGSHSTWYALTVPHISEFWPENGLIREKYVATVNTNIYTMLCFDSNIKHFVLLLEFKHNGLTSIKIIQKIKIIPRS